MIRRSHRTLLVLLLLVASTGPSACTLPFAYIPDDGSGGQDASGGLGGEGSGGELSSNGGSDGSGAAVSGGGSGGGPEAGGTGNGGSGGGGSGGGDSGGGGSGGGTPDGIVVALDATHQTIQGFGLSTARAPSSESLPLDDLFGTTGPNAIGLSILRIGMNSDGSLSGSYIDEAKERGARVIGTVWSPPAAWKDGFSTDDGHLSAENYNSWATTIAQFADAHGLHAMSIGNAPDFASCPELPICQDAAPATVFSANEMVAWVKVAAPIFSELAPTVQLIAPEVMEWNHLWSNLSATGSLVTGHPHSSDPLACGCYGNEITSEAEADCAQDCLDGEGYDYGHFLWDEQVAWESFDIVGVQQYDSQMAYAWPADVNAGGRDKEVWVTEMAGVPHWPEAGPSIDIDNGIAVAGWIHSALTVGEASAWLYGWYEAYSADGNVGLALTNSEPSTIAKRYFALGNYSRFVRPGYVQVEVQGPIPSDVLLSAFKGPEGQLVIIAINQADAPVQVSIGATGGALPAAFTPHETSAAHNLAAQAVIDVVDEVLTVTLPATTITSFVGLASD